MKDIKLEKKSGLKLKGRYKFTIATLETKHQKNLNKQIELFRSQGKQFLHLVKQLNSICKTKVIYADNLITTVGLTLLTNQLTSSSPTNDPQINYCAVGSGTTAPALGDTTLETETYRNLQASQTNASGVGYVTMFISATDDNGTYREFGLFSDASAAADSGVLFSRLAINITKSAVQSLTVDWTLTITNA